MVVFAHPDVKRTGLNRAWLSQFYDGRGKTHQQIEMNEASHRSVEDGGCVRGNAQPSAAFINPGINKALPPHVGLSSFDSLGSKYSGRDGGISEHTHVHRLGRDLLLLGLCWLHAGEKLCFGLNRAVIVY
jgi:hypothetical protein